MTMRNENFNRELQEELHKNVVTVTFTKVNGEQRVMPCTLDASRIPADNLPKNSTKKVNDDVCSVWAIDSNGWRSFRFDSVISYEVK